MMQRRTLLLASATLSIPPALALAQPSVAQLVVINGFGDDDYTGLRLGAIMQCDVKIKDDLIQCAIYPGDAEALRRQPWFAPVEVYNMRTPLFKNEIGSIWTARLKLPDSHPLGRWRFCEVRV